MKQRWQTVDLPMRMLLVPFEPTLRRRFGDDFLSFYDDMAAKATDRLGCARCEICQ